MDPTTKTRLLGVLALIFVIVIGATAVTLARRADKKAADPSGPPVTTDAATMIAAYEKDDKAADARFANRTVEVTGRISKLPSEYANYASYMVLTAPQAGLRIHCKFNEDDQPGARGLHRGLTVTVRGHCIGLVKDDIHMEHCLLTATAPAKELEEEP